MAGEDVIQCHHVGHVMNKRMLFSVDVALNNILSVLTGQVRRGCCSVRPSDGRRGCCSVLTWPNMAGEDVVLLTGLSDGRRGCCSSLRQERMLFSVDVT